VPTATLTVAPPDFRTLTEEVRAAGLLDRRRGYYAIKTALTVGAFFAAWWAFFALGSSWATLAIAAVLGILSTQLGFLGHDAGHRQIFASRRANRAFGQLVGNGMIGLSYGWWVSKHNAHHAHPNVVGRDPDIDVGLAGAPQTIEDGGPRRSLAGWMARRQAEMFFPLMLLRSTGLYVSGVQSLLRRRDRGAITEGLLLAMHVALYLTAVFWVLPPLEALAFLGVHQAVFSVYLGCSFAPNHKGMPILDDDSEMTFVQRQVITSRNIVGGRCTSLALGGLNYQIEHHLFPAMPRPNLPHARRLVRMFCMAQGLDYCEKSLIGSFRQVLQYLRLAAVPHSSAFDNGALTL
jgi:fatty acid desaturase